MYTFDPDGRLYRLRQERDRREIRRVILFAVAWVSGLVGLAVITLGLMQ